LKCLLLLHHNLVMVRTRGPLNQNSENELIKDRFIKPAKLFLKI
jgi:hypothetical protein